jgi:hypothetical protein
MLLPARADDEGDEDDDTSAMDAQAADVYSFGILLWVRSLLLFPVRGGEGLWHASSLIPLPLPHNPCRSCAR